MQDDVSVPPGTIETPGFGRTQFRERKQRSISHPGRLPIKTANPALRTGLLSSVPYGTEFSLTTNDLRDPDREALMLTRMGGCRTATRRSVRLPQYERQSSLTILRETLSLPFPGISLPF